MRRINIPIVYLVLFVFFISAMICGDVDTSLFMFLPLMLCIVEVFTHIFWVRYLYKAVLKYRTLVEADIELDQFAKQHIEDVESKYEDVIVTRKRIWLTFGGVGLVTCLVPLMLDIPFILVLGANLATVILLSMFYGYVASCYVDDIHYSFDKFILDRKMEELEKENQE